jgi:hypothetical protein
MMTVLSWCRRTGVFALPLAAGLVVAACAPRSASPAPVPAAPPQAEPAPAAPPAPATPTVAAPAQPAAADPAAAAAAGAGRGGRGTPPPPPPPPPAVMPAPARPVVSTTPPSPDPRVGLRAGYWDAEQAAWNIRLLSTTPPVEGFIGVTNSDLAFTGDYVIQGSYNGFQIFDVSDPAKPVLVKAYPCPASQSDVSVYGNLLFVSGEGLGGRLDCGTEGVPDPVSAERLRGIRIFDISDVRNPEYVANVQTCRGSHTHTVVTDPNDPANVYIYVSGSSRVRSPEELPGCLDAPQDDPNTALFRIEVIKVPLAAPAQAAIVSSPRIFEGLGPPPRRTEPGRGGAAAAGGGRAGGAAAGGAAAGGGRAGGAAAGGAAAGGGRAGGAAAGGAAAAGGRGGRGGGARTGPTQCHDITVYPDAGLACGGYGLLLDIREVAHPIRIDAAADLNMSFWHSATFSNDGAKVLFSDEWGGGSQPRCRDTDRPEWGANALFTIENNKLVFHSYYKMPAPQTEQENCVAHNGSLIPIPGRDVMVQGWYQGGISVFDWTDPAKPFEVAYFDRGPLNAERLQSAGSWSVYWYNGLIYSSEIARGLDVYDLVASGLISQNELDAAATVRFEIANAQEQRRFTWPPSFALARAYLDQLERASGLAAGQIESARAGLAAAERESGAARREALTRLAASLEQAAAGAPAAAKVRLLAEAVRELAPD